MEKNKKDIRLMCIKTIGPFIEGQEYLSDNRRFTNQNDENDVQVLIIESSEGEFDNCYLFKLDEAQKHFHIIN